MPSSDQYSPWPNYSEEEIEAVSRVLRSNKVNYWTGDECQKFEDEFAAYCGVDHAVAVANGTVALELALRALGIGEGDEVVVPARTFVASATAVMAVGGTPVFADVDALSQTITAKTVGAVLSERTAAVICVHLAGWACPMDEIMALARRHGLYIVEDCAQSHGARYKGQSVGGIGDIGCWSFCQDKIMTTGGEGGMLTTNNPSWWKTIWSYKDHGKDWNLVHSPNHPVGFRWLHSSIGSNLRMTEMQAVIGRIQIAKMPEWSRLRSCNAEIYSAGLGDVDLFSLPSVPQYIVHGWYKYYLQVNDEVLDEGWSRDRIIGEANQAGIPCFSGSCPEVYLERCFTDKGLGPASRLPVARKLGESSLMLLVHPGLSESLLQSWTHMLRSIAQRASA